MPLPGGDFRLFLTRLSLQGFLACGLLDNPLTGTRGINPPTAHMVLADLKMIRDKTVDNLEPGEAQTLDKAIEDMQSAVDGLPDSTES